LTEEHERTYDLSLEEVHQAYDRVRGRRLCFILSSGKEPILYVATWLAGTGNGDRHEQSLAKMPS
jgi:hypothetical protein